MAGIDGAAPVKTIFPEIVPAVAGSTCPSGNETEDVCEGGAVLQLVSSAAATNTASLKSHYSVMRRFALAGLVIAAVAGAGVFAAGSYAAEGALKPPRVPIALSCPCFSHMNCRPVGIRARDGVALKAWFYTTDKPTGKTVILLHGIGASRQEMVSLGYFFLRHGFAVLEPDLRGHGESGGLTTYGALEADDIHRWVDWMAKTADPEQLYGFGVSLGGSVLLDSLQNEARFRAVVAESPYYDFPSIANERIARMLPGGLKWVAAPFVASGITWAKWREGVDLRKASAADGLRSTETPVLLIHGLDDNKTSPENSRRLLAVGAEKTKLWLVPGSAHADVWKKSKVEFELRVLEWFGAT